MYIYTYRSCFKAIGLIECWFVKAWYNLVAHGVSRFNIDLYGIQLIMIQPNQIMGITCKMRPKPVPHLLLKDVSNSNKS